MKVWTYSQRNNQEKLIHHEESGCPLATDEIRVYEGDLLWRPAEQSPLKKARPEFFERFPLFLALVFPLALVVVASYADTSKTVAASNEQILVTDSQVTRPPSVESLTPSPLPTPVPVEARTPVSTQETPSKGPSKAEVPKRERKVEKKSKSNPPTPGLSQPMLQKIRSTVQKTFLRGDFLRARQMLEKVEARNSGKLPHDLWDLEAEIAYAQCGKFIQEKKWRAAVQQCERANARQAHPRAQANLEELGAKAEKAYLEGYVMEGTNRKAAIQRYRDALDMAPTGHLYEDKARKKLQGFDSQVVH